jgi:hypothetical protein
MAQATPGDLKVALIVKNSLGWEIARGDAIFSRADQKTSTQLAPGETLEAYPLARLPYGAPPGDYTVELRVYDETALSGYDVLSAAGAPGGKDLSIGAWRVLPGADWQAVQPEHTLTPVNLVAGAGMTLLAQSMPVADAIPATNGGIVQLAMLWQGQGALPELQLAAEDGSWSVQVPPFSRALHDAISLDWRETRVPANAHSGPATLTLLDGTALARYAVTALPGLFEAPPFATAVGAKLRGAGELLGFTMDQQTVSRSQPVSVTLVWHAGDVTPEAGYTVFVQLVGQDGKPIAQSDAIPALGQRPTTGWRPGEYVVDTHTLTFHSDAAAGPARLIAGLYDAKTGKRVLLADGSDAVTLMTAVDVR